MPYAHGCESARIAPGGSRRNWQPLARRPRIPNPHPSRTGKNQSERLIVIDILLYGVSLGLEFVALIVLRIREPELPRPFRVPGGMPGAIAVGVVPALRLAFSVFSSQGARVLGMSAVTFGMLTIAAGAVAYFINITLRPAGRSDASGKPEPAA